MPLALCIGTPVMAVNDNFYRHALPQDPISEIVVVNGVKLWKDNSRCEPNVTVPMEYALYAATTLVFTTGVPDQVRSPNK